MDERDEPGFGVLYRWRVVAGGEERFRDAWKRVTLALRAQRGALGSRLHRADDGTFAAYAQWPSREAWESSRALGNPDDAAARDMKATVERAWPPLALEVDTDLLERLVE